MSNDAITRRGFLDRLIGISGVALLASVLYPVFKFLVPPTSGEANVSQVKLPFGRSDIEGSAQKAKTFRFGRQLGIILVTSSGELRALQATCTHLDCTVRHQPEKEVLFCACHGGVYDLNGKNIAGPPPRPLEQYVVNEIGTDIFVSKGNA